MAATRLSSALATKDVESVGAICREGISDSDRQRVWTFLLQRPKPGPDLSEKSPMDPPEDREAKRDEKGSERGESGAVPEEAIVGPHQETEINSVLEFQESYESLPSRQAETTQDTETQNLAGEDPEFLMLDDFSPHADEAQVLLDVKRSFTLASHIQMGDSYTTILSKEELKNMRHKLYFLIVQILRKYPCLSYYQGYHDVASVVLLVSTKDDDAFKILELLTLYHLRDYMLSDITLTINHLKLIPMILENAAPELFKAIRSASPSFMDSDGLYYDYNFTPALSSALTLFSHDLASLNHITKIWDFILSHRSVAVTPYIYAAAIMNSQKQILTALGPTESDVEPALLHSLLSPTKLFDNLSDTDLATILTSTSTLISQFGPESSPNSTITYDKWFKQFNTMSVLNTTSSLGPGTRLTLTQESLPLVLESQQTQSKNEAQHEAEEFQRALESAESAMHSSSESEKSSLFSSLSKSSSVPSLTNSSIIQKFFSGTDKPSGPNSSIIRISLFVGFAGVLLHLLLRQSGWHLVFRIPRLVSNGDRSFNLAEFHRVSNVIGEACSHVRDALARESVDLGQIGLGTLRRQIYGLGNVN